MDSVPIIERLWDYGWLVRDSVKLVPATSDLALIEQYISSTDFHNSFLPNDKDETGIHGPFVANRIHADDYIPLHLTNLEDYLETIEFSEIPDENVVERAKIMSHLRSAFAGERKCYVLKRNETNKELFHDWGNVLWVFREFLFVSPQRDALERFIVGLD